MSHKRFLAVLLTVVLLLTFATAVEAGKQTKSKQNGNIARTWDKATAYNFDDGQRGTGSSPKVPLVGTSYSSFASPGVTVGNTYYDYQHNCSQGRMVETGPHTGVTGPTMVHFGWMYMPDSLFSSRSYAYNAFDAGGGGWAGVCILHDPDEEYSGYVNVDVTPDNRGIVGGHSDQKGPIPYMPQMHYDACSGCENFAAFIRLPDALGEYASDCEAEFTWPKFFMQFGTSGVDTVLHVVAMSDCASTGLLTVGYFRYLGYEGLGSWDPTPYVVDTVETISADITGERVGNKVCLSWFANTAYGGCDTCSGPAPDAYAGTGLAQMDNDMYVQVSIDQGENWQPRVNVTQNVPAAEGWKAYCASSVLFDQLGYLHVVWVSNYWDADPLLDGTFAGGVGVYWYTRLFHWSQNVPHVRTVADHTYGYYNCTPPSWAGHVDKPSLSECDGKIYCLYTQFNNIPNGILDDCAAWVDQSVTGATNGELMLSISADYGMTWDLARNLTNTYTPGCDPSHGGADCSNDYWATMSRWGRAVQTGENWAGAVVVDPDPDGYDGDMYLEIQYVEDLDAGGVVQRTAPANELGSFQWDPIKWFRLPCVDPIPNPLPMYTPASIGDPAWALPGVQVDTTLTIENAGNVALEYVMDVQEDNGPTGWLTVSGFSGTVPSGLGNVETGYIHLNTGGVCDYYTELVGRIVFTDAGNSPTFPDTIAINFFVVAEMDISVWDTVFTNCLALSVSNNGNMGQGGIGEVNMDYTNDGECDEDYGNVYMYDGSAIIGWMEGETPTFFYSIWGSSFLDSTGLRAVNVGDEIANKPCFDGDVDFYQSGTFVTQDSTIGMTRAYLAPTADCPWILVYSKVFSYDGASHSGIIVGEGIDWDIPWDYLEDDADQGVSAVNSGGVDIALNLVYQQGYESSTDTTDCQLNTDRFGGNAFVAAYYNGGTAQPVPYAAAVVDNDITQASDGFLAQPLYDEMTYAGLRGTDSVSDLHTLMTFHNDLTLGADDVYEVVCAYATVHEGDYADLTAAINAAKAWYNGNGGIAMFADDDENGQVDACQSCCEVMGDLDGSGQCDGMDVVYFVDWLWNQGPDPSCLPEANVDGIGEVDPMDLVYLVDYMWNQGPAPAPCQ